MGELPANAIMDERPMIAHRHTRIRTNLLVSIVRRQSFSVTVSKILQKENTGTLTLRSRGHIFSRSRGVRVRYPQWKYSASKYLGQKHYMIYRDEHLGVELRIETSMVRSWFSKAERRLYCIDGVDTRFTSERAMMRMLRKVWERESRDRHSLIVHMARSAYTYEDRQRPLFSRLAARLRNKKTA